jgi:hypothetical protein
VSEHVVTIRGQYKDNFRVECSCKGFVEETDEITLDRLNELVHEHIEAAEAEVINDARLDRTCSVVGPIPTHAPWLKPLTCDLRFEQHEPAYGGKLQHHDPVGIYWIEPSLPDVPSEGYGTKSAVTSEDAMIDITTGDPYVQDAPQLGAHIRRALDG